MYLTDGYRMPSRSDLMLFPFDDHALPFTGGVRLSLSSFRHRPSQTVVGLGPPGSSDCVGVTYYGTVRRVGDELWMWYLGLGDRDEGRWHERMHLATSTDGRTWEKPDLGAVDYFGSRNNNLVDLSGGDHLTSAVVYHEPDDPDPRRRFKMVFEAKKYANRLSVAYSEDGIVWVEHPDNPVGPYLEQAGGIRFNGAYYVSGQGPGPWSPKGGTRVLVNIMSYDFDHWTMTTCTGFRRDPLPPRPTEYGSSIGPQVHLGAAMWDRGNAIVGFYGMWNGLPADDRRLVYMDLGMVVSNDALHFREPIPDFPIVQASEIGYGKAPNPATVRFPALIQGQGFENVGDETLFWYAPWPENNSDGVRLASWPRDRLGCFEPFTADGPNVISAPIDLEGKPAALRVNVDGLSAHAELRVSVIDRRFRPLPGYGSEACTGPERSGFAEPVTWRGRQTIACGEPVRLRFDFGGVRPEDVKLFAAYLEDAAVAGAAGAGA